MAILNCAVPAFPMALLARAEPALAEKPLALVGPEGRVLAATPPALQAGVRVGQTPRQAQVACPDLHLHDADLPALETEFDALLALLDDFSDRVEPLGLGRAYLDVPDLDERTALPFCQDLGRRVRQVFGTALQPSLGCDSGKFTAQAAAHHTRPGTVRVVLGAAERPFLRPLSVGLLPLPDESQWRLELLGIRSLGQYADLPSRAVLQQFGQAGRLAQQWARGRDERPVIPRHRRPSLTVSTDFEYPIEAAPPLLLEASRLLEVPITRLQDRFQAAQALTATRTDTTGQQTVDVWRLPTPSAARARFAQLLAGRWQSGPWEAPVAGLSLVLSEIQDVAGLQLGLFPSATPPRTETDLVRQWRVRFGAERLRRARVVDPRALCVERRVQWQEWAS